MDFSQIEKLHLGQEDTLFYDRMKNELPSLRHLSFDWAHSGTHAPSERIDFLKSQPALESLSITIGASYYGCVDQNRTQFPLGDILSVHGPSLHSLTLTQRESQLPSHRRPMLSLPNITAIRRACPNLHHLALDIDRNASTGWPNATLDALTAIPSLTNLTLRLEIGADLHASDRGEYVFNPDGLQGPGPFREPRMSISVAETLFSGLQGKKVGRKLEKVEFVVGDFEDKPNIGPLYLPNWEEGRARKFVCQAKDEVGADRQGKCEIVGDGDPYVLNDWDDLLGQMPLEYDG